jgi:MscS family membrane protein
MKHLLDQQFLSNTLRDYLWAAGIILIVFLLKKNISRYTALLFANIFKREWKNFDRQKFIDLIIRPLSVFFVITVSIVTIYQLNFPHDLNVKIYRFTLQRIILALAVTAQLIALTRLLLRMIDFIAGTLESRARLTNDPADNQLIVFFRDFLKVIIGIIGVLMILRYAFRYNISSLLTGLSIVGAAIALSLRESLENLIASFVIFFDKPFTTGDTVKVQGITGIVEKIGLRSTRIRSEQKTFVTVPNKQMVDTILDNQSLRTYQKTELSLQISLDTPSAKVEELITEIRSFLTSVAEIEKYNVWFNDINVQAYAVSIEYFVPAAYVSIINQVKQKVNLFILKSIEHKAIMIAGKGKEVILNR